MGRHHPHSDSHAYADTYSHRYANAEPRCFSVADWLAWRVAGTDVCIPASNAERERLARSSFAKRFAIADGNAVALAIAECDTFPDGIACEKRLPVTGKGSWRLDTETPE